MTEEYIAEHNGMEAVKLTTPATGEVMYCLTFPANNTIHFTPEAWTDFKELMRKILND